MSLAAYISRGPKFISRMLFPSAIPLRKQGETIIIIINKVLIKVTLNKVIAGALYIVICG